MNDFSFIEPAACASIKVIGVGGAGCNAVQHMVEVSQNMIGVEFISANTDIQSLSKNIAPVKMQLGPQLTKGLGAGSRPEIGCEAAVESTEDIRTLLKGADMVFIAAGMGGGTGTGAAPIVAEIAKSLGILTVAVVTKPFMFEGKRKNQFALDGLKKLEKNVDSLIVIPNERLLTVLGKEVSVLGAFAAANRVLSNAVLGIAEIINKTGLINPDFNDVRTVMSETGMAIMCFAEASGEGCAAIAAAEAVSSPLLGDAKLSNARGMLVYITTSTSFTLGELYEVMNSINACAREDATVVYGHVFDENMQDGLRVIVVATGLPSEYSSVPQSPPNSPSQGIRSRVGEADNPPPKDEPELGSNRRASVDAMKKEGESVYDIPTFLRRKPNGNGADE